MAVSADMARKLALKLPEAQEAPHFDRAAFRTPRRIFATLGADGADMNFMFDLDQQELFCGQAPKAFAPVAGGWGRMGATRCLLAKCDVATFRSALPPRMNARCVRRREHDRLRWKRQALPPPDVKRALNLG